MSTKNLFTALVLIVCLITPIRSTIWDNIFSQTQASHPINLTQSFNIDFELPKQYDLDGNFDFNTQMKTLTLTLSKNILIQKLVVIKAQIDLQELVLNVDQFLLGCEKFMIGVQDEVNDKIKERVSNVGVSKKSLFMINLLFKYIGRYQLKSQKNKGSGNNNKKQLGGILDIFKDTQILDELEQALGSKIHPKQQHSDVQYLDMFEFSAMGLMQQNSNKLIQKLSKDKNLLNEAKQHSSSGIDLQAIDWQMFKFVLLTYPHTGEITKVYRNRQMKQELQFTLHSNEKSRVKCNKVAKKLTFEDLTDGAKYLYDNRDTLGNVLN